MWSEEKSKKCMSLWQKAHLQVKIYKIPQFRSIFWSSNVEKLHAAVAESTFASKNKQKILVPKHFLKF